jgi:two-component system LytT family sensor kinase
MVRSVPDGRRFRELLRTALRVVALWTAFALLGVLQYVFHSDQPLAAAIASNAFFAISWVIVTPLIIAAAAALMKPRGAWSQAGLVLALLAMPSAAVLLRDALTGHDTLAELRTEPLGVVGGIYENLFLAALIVLVTVNVHALRRNARRRRLEAEQTRDLTRAQLQVLRASLEPHFLFNALNSVAALIRSDANEARHVLRQLSDLLHTPVFTRDEVPLRDEVAFVRRYIAIQQTRFCDRLAVHVEVSAAAGDALVPSLILQPLVENAIVHGIAGRGGTGVLEVRAETSAGQVLLLVRDTGTGFDADNRETGGIGLSSVRKRLRLLYGAQHSVTFTHEQDGFSVRVVFPAKWMAA